MRRGWFMLSGIVAQAVGGHAARLRDGPMTVKENPLDGSNSSTTGWLPNGSGGHLSELLVQ